MDVEVEGSRLTEDEVIADVIVAMVLGGQTITTFSLAIVVQTAQPHDSPNSA